MSKYERAQKAYQKALHQANLNYAEAKLKAALDLAEALGKREEN